MLYAVDAAPAYQQLAYEVAPARSAYATQGNATPRLDALTNSSPRATDARIHCVISSASHSGMAICDNATLISLNPAKASGMHPAVLQESLARPAVMAASAAMSVAMDSDGEAATAAELAASPARRWFADLLMTAGLGLVLVSCSLFITSRVPRQLARPARVRHSTLPR